MKAFPDSAAPESLVHALASATGWSATRIGDAARGAARRLKRPDPAESVASPSLARQVPEVAPNPPPGPTRSLEMQLASGRSVRVRMPAVASRRELQSVGRVAAQNAHRQSETLARHAQALDALRDRNLQLEQRLDAVQAQADLALLAALRGSSSLVQKLSETVRRVEAQEQVSRELGAKARFQERLARGQNVRSAVSAMQVAAYGERGNVFATNNLLLGASELLWGSIDTLLRRAGLWSRPDPVPLTWVGPLLGLAVGQVTVGQQQFERFVSGQLQLTPLGKGAEVGRFFFRGSLDLRPHIAPGFWDEFRQRPAVPATAQVAEARAPGITVALVQFGTLEVLALARDVDAVTVTWTVDVEAPGG
jgi:hypothetical protein